MQIITLEVSHEIAEAYQFTPLEERQQIQQIVSLLLKKENDIDFLRKIMDEISDRASARGLTPEILDEFLNLIL
ncbi:hypothetical protein H6F32_09100 [Anabaena sp. FACHB-1237]|uniref:hypothetical protein n=1 Tax=Anabaena sp. FACHB-1237 TaxID=2692769 RepID=UPI0016811E26|nr:hypothetical protein [Anabaena sp. FACHB-1237]MBD2137741.1 hypothetical protein [Anabaena sp. FACHB-1237]